jgi:hypothetical protein
VVRHLRVAKMVMSKPNHLATMTTPNFELLKDAYQIIEGVPTENVDMSSWFSQYRGLSAATNASPAGWLALHPTMNASGLHAGANGVRLVRTPTHKHYENSWVALGLFFGIGMDDVVFLFSPRNNFEDGDVFGDTGHFTDKTLFLARLRHFLKRHCQLSFQIEARRLEFRRAAVQESNAGCAGTGGYQRVNLSITVTIRPLGGREMLMLKASNRAPLLCRRFRSGVLL